MNKRNKRPVDVRPIKTEDLPLEERMALMCGDKPPRRPVRTYYTGEGD